MKEKIEKIKNNKVISFLGNLIYIILFLIVFLMLIVVILQRATDNSLTLGGYRLFNVLTGSMIPKYEVGDTLIAKEVDPSSLKIGDDVVYKGKEDNFKDKIVTHQIIDIKNEDGNYKITTKGIANDIEDPQIDQSQLYGKIIYKVKTLSVLGKMVKNIYVFYFMIFVPIVVIIFKQIYNVIKNNEEDDDEEKNANKK